jgi:hypothetical protein
MAWRRKKAAPFVWVDNFYGEHHQVERAKYAASLRSEGGQCMERICVMQTRRIAPGAPWHLAHDHEAHSATAYLGPAHPECNKHEKQLRDHANGMAEMERGGTYWVNGSDGQPVPYEGWDAYHERRAAQSAQQDREERRVRLIRLSVRIAAYATVAGFIAFYMMS